jgi:hypothetical protein
MKIVAIHQPQYLPYLGFFHKIAHCDVFVALDNVQFQKNGLQNRNRIRSPQGWQWLTVPILHHFGQNINEVQLDQHVPWPRKHWNALLANYARAPFFRQYGQGLKALLLDGSHSKLCDLNMAMTNWVLEQLGSQTSIISASTLGAAGDQTELLINICRAVQANGYLSGPGGRRYMDLVAFENAGITVIWQEFASPVYDQRSTDLEFIPDLSVVDALFYCGPRTAELVG